MSEATPDVTPLLLKALSRRFTQTAPAPQEAASKVSPERWSYREAAAVLHCFDPGQLLPRDPRLAVDSPRALLFGDTVPAIGGREEGFQALRPEVRREALGRLRSRDGLCKALKANPDRPMTDVQRMLEAWLAGTAPKLENQSYEELNQTLQVVAWLGEVVPDLLSETRVRDLLARRSVLRPFEHLVRQDFVGRQSELEKLRNYVGVLPPSSFTSKAARYFSSLRKLQPALLLYGPGGIGKSALVGRFLYEHSEAPPELRFPFAYLPFDNQLLKPGEPYTLLVEAAEQLARQYPERQAAHESFRRKVEDYRSSRAALAGQTSGSGSRSAKLREVGQLDQSLFEDFGDLLKELAGGGGVERPALLVLDTFEEVQYRPAQELVGLGRMLKALQNRFPNLRIVASGRAPAERLILNDKPTPMPLDELDVESARQLLKLQGVSDAKLADSMVRQLGRNPLTLKLAARAVASHPEIAGDEGLEGITTRRFGVIPVSQEIIQGQLYRRVLGHIHDPDVRKLAHPGMVLRRVTPDTIREVLSKPCGVAVPDEKRARQLFRELRKEHSLVRLEDTETLQYRPEVRQPMLRLLEREKPAQVREIHEAAFYFWQLRTGTAARAEELYHRLALDQEAWQLESRWLPETGPSLAASREELPPRAAAWLASHLGLRVDPEVQEAATQADWERSTGRQVINLLRFEQVEAALAELGERTGKRLPGSALYPLEARAYLLIGEFRLALEALERGLENMPLTGNPGRHAEMLWLHAQAATSLNHLGVADASLARAEIVAREIADPLCRLQIITQRLILFRRRGREDSGAEVLRNVLALTLQRLDEAHIDREPVLVRIAASELEPERWPGLLRKIVETVGIGTLSPDAESALRASLFTESSPQPQSSLDSLLRRAFATARDAGPVGAAVIAALRSQGLTLEAANLAGIEEYREPWETEISSEAFA